MRVRCSFCGAEYDAAVTPAALGLVGRCERCGRSGLHPADDDEEAQVIRRPRERSDADP
jgi:hypothetical protein